MLGWKHPQTYWLSLPAEADNNLSPVCTWGSRPPSFLPFPIHTPTPDTPAHAQPLGGANATVPPAHSVRVVARKRGVCNAGPSFTAQDTHLEWIWPEAQ